MDIYDDDLFGFWQSLNKNQVKYIMAGGFAVNMHGYIRATKDADFNGVLVPFLHINQLLANKKAVSRSKDQIDIIALEKIKEERRQMGLD